MTGAMFDELKKMIQAVINGQSALKEELLGEIGKVRGEVNKLRDEFYLFKDETNKNFEKVNERLDKQGKQLAILDDDLPSGVEFRELKKEVWEIKHKLASV